MKGREGVSVISHMCDQQQFVVKKAIFSTECLIINCNWFQQDAIFALSGYKVQLYPCLAIHYQRCSKGEAKQAFLFVKLAFLLSCMFKITPCLCFPEQVKLAGSSSLHYKAIHHEVDESPQKEELLAITCNCVSHMSCKIEF